MPVRRPAAAIEPFSAMPARRSALPGPIATARPSTTRRRSFGCASTRWSLAAARKKCPLSAYRAASIALTPCRVPLGAAGVGSTFGWREPLGGTGGRKVAKRDADTGGRMNELFVLKTYDDHLAAAWNWLRSEDTSPRTNAEDH